MKLTLLLLLATAPALNSKGEAEADRRPEPVSQSVVERVDNIGSLRKSRLDAIFDFPISKALGIEVNLKEPPPVIQFGPLRMVR